MIVELFRIHLARRRSEREGAVPAREAAVTRAGRHKAAGVRSERSRVYRRPTDRHKKEDYQKGFQVSHFCCSKNSGCEIFRDGLRPCDIRVIWSRKTEKLNSTMNP